MSALSTRAHLRPSSRAGLVIAGTVAAVLALVAVLVAAAGHRGVLTVPKAVILGLVEGLTEYLPVSSTGHLTVAERLLHLKGDAADAYAVVIQAGAILAVLVLYRDRVLAMVDGLRGRDAAGRGLFVALVTAFVPAALIGAAFGDTIKAHLFGVGPVAAAWAVGGVVLVFAGRMRRTGLTLEHLGLRAAFVIGVAQALALWPGMSRSLVTILGGLAVGLSLAAAVEFSFLLGLLTLGAATAYDALKQGHTILHAYGVVAPLVGFVIAFVTAVAAIRWMVTYLQRGTLTGFGYYRLAAAAVAVALLLTHTV